MSTHGRDRREAPRTLDGVWERVWTLLERGASDAAHGFHLPVLATTRPGVGVAARTVVLRRAVRAEGLGLVVCHTDARSEKAREIRAGGHAAWVFYDREEGEQVRIEGPAELVTDGPFADEQWRASTLSSRRCYLAPRAPGLTADAPSVNLPAHLPGKAPTAEESEAGRAKFAIIVGRAETVEYLHLSAWGQTRAKFEPAGGSWLEP
jgi:pyridoxamine 5'-phosphate oxidase